MIKRAFTSLLLLIVAVSAPIPASAQTEPRAVPTLPSADGENRVALVIGNSKYRFSPLRNPANDARAMVEALENVGFEVIVKLNASRREMRRSMIQFGRRLQEGGVGLFYYAGHGVQLYGENYLIPVGAEIEAEDHVEVEAIELNQVLARMGGARNRLNIVILDACRNNPFARTFRSSTRGLAQTLAPAGTYIAYATAPGDVAEDGVGRNSLYTQALMRLMRQPGLTIENVFKQVRSRVYRETKGKQVPWTSSSITGDFYFVPQPSKRIAAPSLKSFGSDQHALELAFWNSIQSSRLPSDYRAYLNRFPNGIFAELARNRLAAMTPPNKGRKGKPDATRKAAQGERTRKPPPRVASIDPASPSVSIQILSKDERKRIEQAILRYYETKGSAFDRYETGNSHSTELEIARFFGLSVLKRVNDTIVVAAKYEASDVTGNSRYHLVRNFTLKMEKGRALTVIKVTTAR